MKNIIAITAVALSLTAPAFADVSNARAFFALTNDSPAENIVRSTSVGNPTDIQRKNIASKDSAAERNAPAIGTYATRGDNLAARAIFALTNDSPAENIIR